MKKRSWLLVLLVVVLVLSACSSGDNQQNQNGKVFETRPVSSAFGGTPSPGAPLTPGVVSQKGTPASGNASGATQVPTLQPTPQAIETASLATGMLNTQVTGEAGRLGQVVGMVMDPGSGKAQYLAIETIGSQSNKTFLLPWGAFQIVTLAPTMEQQGGTHIPVVWLNVSTSLVANAPEVDMNKVQGNQLMKGWDQTTRQYWTGKVPQMPVTGSSGGSSAAKSIVVDYSMIETGDLKVQDPNGQDVGKIMDLVIDTDGSILFGLMDLTEITNLGNKKVVIPWSSLVWQAGPREFLLKANNASLNNAPRYDPSDPPDTTIPGWYQPWQDFWRQSVQPGTPEPTGTALQGMIQATRLIGGPVLNVDKHPMGRVADLIFGQDGIIQYLVVDDGQKFHPVPWSVFQLNLDQNQLVYLDDQQRFQDAPSYASLDDIHPFMPNWDANLRPYWGLSR